MTKAKCRKNDEWEHHARAHAHDRKSIPNSDKSRAGVVERVVLNALAMKRALPPGYLRLRRIVLAIVFGEADPPKSELASPRRNVRGAFQFLLRNFSLQRILKRLL
jgi:hypothetical protein